MTTAWKRFRLCFVPGIGRFVSFGRSNLLSDVHIVHRRGVLGCHRRFGWFSSASKEPSPGTRSRRIFVPCSEQQFRDEVRAMTSRKSHCVPQGEVVERVNRYVRGWVNYFHLHNSTRVFVRQRFFLEQRMRKYLQRRRQVKGFGYRRWPSAKLYKEFGLYAIPQYAPYRRTRMP